MTIIKFEKKFFLLFTMEKSETEVVVEVSSDRRMHAERYSSAKNGCVWSDDFGHSGSTGSHPQRTIS